MACAGGEDSDVAGFQPQGTAAASAELHPAFAAGNAEHFMDAGMVVHIVVNAVALGIAPAVTFKNLFKHGRRIEVVPQSDCAAINDKRAFRMIWNHTVILEADCAGLPFADETAEGATPRPRPAGEVFGDLLYVFQHWHRSYPM